MLNLSNKNTENNSANEALYRAVRVAIIDVSDKGSGEGYGSDGYKTTGTTKNLLPIADGWTMKDGDNAGSLKDSPFAMTGITESILNWYGRDVATGAAGTTALNATTGAVSGAKAAVASIASNKPTYGEAVVYNPIYAASTNENNHVVELAAPTTGNAFGVAHKAVIRVWLEGEDPDCWNETAGQDWSINLKFSNETANKTTAYSGSDITGVVTTKQIPAD